MNKTFSNCFNAYTKSVNKRYNRQEAFFRSVLKERKYRIEIYFKTIVAYILTNAVKHGLCSSSDDYPHSSFEGLKNEFDRKNNQNKIIKYFESKDKLSEFIRNYECQLLANKFLLVEEV